MYIRTQRKRKKERENVENFVLSTELKGWSEGDISKQTVLRQ